MCTTTGTWTLTTAASPAAPSLFAVQSIRTVGAAPTNACSTVSSLPAAVGFAVPMSMERYICRESAERISASSSSARRIEMGVLPEAVGAVITMSLPWSMLAMASSWNL